MLLCSRHGGGSRCSAPLRRPRARAFSPSLTPSRSSSVSCLWPVGPACRVVSVARGRGGGSRRGLVVERGRWSRLVFFRALRSRVKSAWRQAEIEGCRHHHYHIKPSCFRANQTRKVLFSTLFVSSSFIHSAFEPRTTIWRDCLAFQTPNLEYFLLSFDTILSTIPCCVLMWYCRDKRQLSWERKMKPSGPILLIILHLRVNDLYWGPFGYQISTI